MTRRFTVEERRAIINSHISEYGVFEPIAFVEEARSSNHPAHEWFTWDDSVAGHRHRIFQARQFVHVRVVARIEERGSVTVTVRKPAFVARESTDEGGYVSVTSRVGEDDLRWQALDGGFGLRSWLRRYEAVLQPAEVKAVNSLIGRIERGNKVAA